MKTVTKKFACVCAVLLGAVVFLACGIKPAASADTARATERSAVDLAKDAWVLVAEGCVDAAEAASDDTIRAKCAKALVPAHDLIVDAAKAVDTQWSPNAACGLAQAATLMAGAAGDLNLPGIMPTVTDAKLLATALAGTACSADAGAEGGAS